MSNENFNAMCEMLGKTIPWIVGGAVTAYAIHKDYSFSVRNGNQSFMCTPSAEDFAKWYQPQQLQQQQLLPPQTFNGIQLPQQVNEFLPQK